MLKQIGKIILCLVLVLTALPGYPANNVSAQEGPVAPQISAGYWYSISLTSSGEVWSWGANDFGQLGIGNNTTTGIPKKADGLADVVSIHSGIRSTFAVKRDGSVWAWGDNREGQLGIGNNTIQYLPTQIPGLSGVADIKGGEGYHTLALMKDGSVWAWGKNTNGQLGIGTKVSRNTPSVIPGLSGIKAVAAGGYHSLVLKSDGTVWAFGFNNEGELGDGTTLDQVVPVQVQGLDHVTAISAGFYHNVALKDDGTVWTWGRNNDNQLGDGSADDRGIPVQVSGLSGIKAIAAGGYHSLALDERGHVWAWGLNGNGQIGDGTMNNASRAVPISGEALQNVVSIAGGGYHSLAVKSDGTVWTWGKGRSGQLAMGSYPADIVDRSSPVKSKAVLDTTPPTVEDRNITAVEVLASEVTLKWTKATDNMLDQEKLQYQVYRSTSSNLNTVAQIEMRGTPVGTYTQDMDTVRVTGLIPNTTYYFNVIVKDAGGEYKTAYQMQKAVTRKPAIYSLSYDGNGSTGGAVPVDNALYEEGAAATVADNSGKLTREGSTFAGWNTRADGTGQGYLPGSTLILGAANVILYAQWKPDTPPDPDPVLRATRFTPVPGSAGVPKNTDLTIEFSSAVEAVPGKRLTVFKQQDSSVVETIDAADPARVTISGKTVTVTLSKELEPDAGYYIGINPGALVDKQGHSYAGITDPGTWSFSTAAVPSEENGDSSLSSLSVKSVSGEVELSPAFASGTKEYKAGLPNMEPGVQVQAVTTEAHASVTVSVYGSGGKLTTGPISLQGELSPLIPLEVGSSRLEFLVTAQRGSTSTYGVEVARAAPADGGGNSGNPPGGNPGGGEPGGSPNPPISSDGGSSAVDSNPQPAGIYMKAYLNGQEMDQLASVEESSRDGGTALSLTLNESRLSALLVGSQNGSKITFPVQLPAERITVKLPESLVPLLIRKESVLQVQTLLGSYTIPVEELIQPEGGQQTQSGETEETAPMTPTAPTIQTAPTVPTTPMTPTAPTIQTTPMTPTAPTIQTTSTTPMIPMTQASKTASPHLAYTISISTADKSAAGLIQKAGEQENFKVVAPPVDFTITATIDGRTSELHTFRTYIEREIPLPEGTASSQVSTAVALEADGTIHPVPTRITVRDGHGFAVVKSLTNSVYALIRQPASFSDMDGHWAKQAVADLTSRRILSGLPGAKYAPDAPVTRAEFTSILVRAMGLGDRRISSSPFKDVKPEAWYSGAAARAHQYGMGQTDPSGLFRPDQKVTREEAMILLMDAMKLAGVSTRLDAMKLAGVSTRLEAGEIERQLAGFKDQDQTHTLAREAAAVLIKARIIYGADELLQPLKGVTRAETAVMINRMLLETGLTGR